MSSLRASNPENVAFGVATDLCLYLRFISNALVFFYMDEYFFVVNNDLFI